MDLNFWCKLQCIKVTIFFANHSKFLHSIFSFAESHQFSKDVKLIVFLVKTFEISTSAYFVMRSLLLHLHRHLALMSGFKTHTWIKCNKVLWMQKNCWIMVNLFGIKNKCAEILVQFVIFFVLFLCWNTARMSILFYLAHEIDAYIFDIREFSVPSFIHLYRSIHAKQRNNVQ